ncbi:hypothetical protein LQ953_14925 [Sphingomonas sp. IC-56]|uniref:hypothetical protein n=1 Tax=Sphingomonas sp. IC-56 TaxID=2898529 RepID=UPI001E5579A7|nr:hypothetical protein [Sphingomonas sp. IC-56]MCD2325313.1 hypothetical protein [Sphingomonas sp. IC-56]
MTKKYPWDIHSDLTEERLVKVAGLIRRGREDALDRHNEDIGDDNWLLGCSAYRFGCFRIDQAAETEAYPWLVVLNPSLEFVFQIGAYPVRFFRDDADEPSMRGRARAHAELDQMHLALPTSEDTALTCRFVVNTDGAGSVLAIKFVAFEGEMPVMVWDVPLGAEPVYLPIAAEAPSEGVDLPAPAVRLPSEEKERKGGAA